MMPQTYSNIENESRDPQVCGEMFRLASRDPTVALTLADALHGDSYDSVLADRAAWLEKSGALIIELDDSWENLQENPIFDGKNHGFL